MIDLMWKHIIYCTQTYKLSKCKGGFEQAVVTKDIETSQYSTKKLRERNDQIFAEE